MFSSRIMWIPSLICSYEMPVNCVNIPLNHMYQFCHIWFTCNYVESINLKNSLQATESMMQFLVNFINLLN